MSSTFVTMDPAKLDRTGVFHNTPPIPVWLQFVPGIVKTIIVNAGSAGYTSPSDVNSILAKPHITDNVSGIDIGTTKYYPLLRGMTDTPVKGDQVLLCTFGGMNYYLGPINTQNNPNKNMDHLYTMNQMQASYDPSDYQSLTSRDQYGYSNNFKIVPHRRLNKLDNPDLDRNEDSIFDHHGDMLFEGRHGNSVRIGSRNVNPYIFISNGRNEANPIESLGDGSLISITESGSLNTHFSGYIDLEREESVAGFTLASDSVIGSTSIPISEMVSAVDSVDDSYSVIYDYGGNQTLLHSDRILINSKRDSIFLSSAQHVHIGSGRATTISSIEQTVVDSEKTVKIGKNADQSLVKGETLKEILTDIVDVIQTLKVTGTISGTSLSLDPMSMEKMTQLSTKISGTSYLSSKHKIE